MSPAPGRAGRAEAERRLQTARRGAELLERKQRILELSIAELSARAAAAQRAFAEAAASAARWQARSAALDGMEQILEARPAETAEVRVRLTAAMGSTYPAGIDCTVPPNEAPGGSSALAFSVQAHREALQAAVRVAAARRAVEVVEADLEATRTRQRAVENRWIPRLEQALELIRRRIEEQELEETLRLRWAADRQPARGPG